MDKSKRVLFAISNLTYGGIQTQALTLAKGLQRKGARIYFFYINRYDTVFVEKELKANDYKVIDGKYLLDNKLQKYSWRLNRYWTLLRTIFLIRFYKIDYVIPYQDQLSYLFGRLHPYSGAEKTLFHIRNTVVENQPKQKWNLKKALQNKPTIIANSNHARIKFGQVYGKHYDFDIQTIYNGVSIRSIDSSVNWKQHFNVESIDFVVTVIANFFKEKDYITIFKAWQLFIKQTEANAKLLIAGDEGILGLMETYKAEVKALGIENHVVFLGRTPFNIELLSISNCNILSTLNEGLPNSVIETLAMGVPFVGTDVAGVKEVVGDAYPIPLFSIGDYETLGTILIKINNKAFDLQRIHAYSLERCNFFTTDKLIENYSNIIAL